MTNKITIMLSQIEPAAGDVYASNLEHDAIAKYSIAISMKRIADFLAAFEARIETSMALDGKSNGSEH